MLTPDPYGTGGAQYPQPPQPKKKRRWPWVLLIVLGILTAIGGVSAAIQGPTKNKPQAQSSSTAHAATPSPSHSKFHYTPITNAPSTPSRRETFLSDVAIQMAPFGVSSGQQIHMGKELCKLYSDGDNAGDIYSTLNVQGQLKQGAIRELILAAGQDLCPEYADTSGLDPTGVQPSSSHSTPAPKPTHTLSVAQQQAIGSAKSYLSFQAFSKRGLIQQLASKAGEGFGHRLAAFAVNHIKVNWYHQAAKSAKSYLKFEHFSCSGLVDQLHSPAGEGFTLAQAQYGARAVGLC